MPIATAFPIRELVVTRYREGVAKSHIAKQLGLSRGTVTTLIKRYESGGQEGLVPNYAACGRRVDRSEDFIFRAYQCLKTWHPGYGYDRISSQISTKRPGLKLPDRRTVYRWWNAKGLVIKRLKTRGRSAPWTKELHEGWQVDAKEKMKLADGSRCCWLNIVDEGSGTVVDPPVFPL